MKYIFIFLLAINAILFGWIIDKMDRGTDAYINLRLDYEKKVRECLQLQYSLEELSEKKEEVVVRPVKHKEFLKHSWTFGE